MTIKAFENKIWLASPYMHEEEQKYVKDAEAIRGAQGMWFQILANIAIFVPLGILAGGINPMRSTTL